MSSDDNQRRWERLKNELSAVNASEKLAWGGIDDLLLARYLAGETEPEETHRVEFATKQYPAVRAAIDVVRNAMADTVTEPVGDPPSQAAKTPTTKAERVPNGRINRTGSEYNER